MVISRAQRGAKKTASRGQIVEIFSMLEIQSARVQPDFLVSDPHVHFLGPAFTASKYSTTGNKNSKTANAPPTPLLLQSIGPWLLVSLFSSSTLTNVTTILLL